MGFAHYNIIFDFYKGSENDNKETAKDIANDITKEILNGVKGNDYKHLIEYQEMNDPSGAREDYQNAFVQVTPVLSNVITETKREIQEDMENENLAFLESIEYFTVNSGDM